MNGLTEWAGNLVRKVPAKLAGSSEMNERRRVDHRKAINAISDVVQNRPRPFRIFDQIHRRPAGIVTLTHGAMGGAGVDPLDAAYLI